MKTRTRWILMASAVAISLALTTASWWWLTQRHDSDAYLRRLADQAAWRHGVDPTLVRAVVQQESQFRPDARGKAGERGLMQLMPGAVEDWQTHNHRSIASPGALFDPALNLEIGTWYLSRALQHWASHPDQEILALFQYNAGRSHALKIARIHEKNVLPHIPISSSRHYIKSVLRYRSYYLEQQTGNPANGQAQKSNP